MSEIELILTKLKIVSETKEQGCYLCDKEHSKILLDYIQQKENIIKEVREYIEKNTEEKKSWLNGIPDYTVFKGDAKELLEILEKENKE